ncbi:hypothetical protein [Tepidibacter hydrothermalis]|uniref:Phage tail protein n=1 Tax=Tepidibacter hydrothermalis TaxID=3036126 RepID=A0ABY8EHL0_9FIRM|nr:hypothetical protein [Tepidibacter hydrothermalis]WFD12452.1 hypothetical protein P4S50_19935 [Tepidibacter hydrothermalis]
MYVEVESLKHKKNYKIKRMSEFDIETSLDIPADHFNIVIENPVGADGKGMNTGIFTFNDIFTIKENDKVILDGISDDVDESWDENSNRIEIDGRDKSLLLLENDAVPQTYKKIKFSTLLKKIAQPYGFNNFKVNSKFDKTLDKVVVDVGMSEWDVVSQQAKKCGMWLWCTQDSTIIADVLNYKEDAIYTFTNDMSIKNAIRVKRFSKRKRGADVKSEVWIRGQGKKKSFTSKYLDKVLSSWGIKRRMILENGEAKKLSHGQSVAKRNVEERKRGTLEIEITINGKYDIQTNKTAWVKDSVTDTNETFFIVGIRHKKNNNEGNVKIIRLRPLWEGL